MSCINQSTPLCKNKCRSLSGLYVLLRLIESHLVRRDFINDTLNENVLPNSTPIIFTDAVDQNKNADANPVVAYNVGDINIARTKMGGMNYAYVINEVSTNLILTVSSSNKTITRELAFELGSMLMASAIPLQNYDVYIGGVNVGSTQKDKSNNYFLSNVTTNVSLGKQVWQSVELESKLREMKLKLEELFKTELETNKEINNNGK